MPPLPPARPRHAHRDGGLRNRRTRTRTIQKLPLHRLRHTNPSSHCYLHDWPDVAMTVYPSRRDRPRMGGRTRPRRTRRPHAVHGDRRHHFRGCRSPVSSTGWVMQARVDVPGAGSPIMDVADDWAPDACTLPTSERPLRVAEFDDLFAYVLRSDAARAAPDSTLCSRVPSRPALAIWPAARANAARSSRSGSSRQATTS